MQKISFILLLSVAFLIGDALWAAEQLSSTAGTTVSSLASDTLSEIKELVDTHRIYPYEGSSIAPSGRYVAYTEWDPQVPSLFLMDMITGSRVQIASAIVPALSWSHDGRYLSFVFDGKGKNGLSIYDTSEHTIKAIPGIESHAPLVWSDDGALILVHMSKKNVVES